MVETDVLSLWCFDFVCFHHVLFEVIARALYYILSVSTLNITKPAVKF